MHEHTTLVDIQKHACKVTASHSELHVTRVLWVFLEAENIEWYKGDLSISRPTKHQNSCGFGYLIGLMKSLQTHCMWQMSGAIAFLLFETWTCVLCFHCNTASTYVFPHPLQWLTYNPLFTAAVRFLSPWYLGYPTLAFWFLLWMQSVFHTSFCPEYLPLCAVAGGGEGVWL